jgi:hypothetical protein
MSTHFGEVGKYRVVRAEALTKPSTVRAEAKEAVHLLSGCSLRWLSIRVFLKILAGSISRPAFLADHDRGGGSLMEKNRGCILSVLAERFGPI